MLIFCARAAVVSLSICIIALHSLSFPLQNFYCVQQSHLQHTVCLSPPSASSPPLVPKPLSPSTPPSSLLSPGRPSESSQSTLLTTSILLASSAQLVSQPRSLLPLPPPLASSSLVSLIPPSISSLLLSLSLSPSRQSTSSNCYFE